MKYHQRQFSADTDIYRMADLAGTFATENLHVFDLPYRLSSWALDHAENTCLWFDEGQQLAAWAVLQTPFWTMDYVCHPAAEAHLHREILAWADRRAREIAPTELGHPAWYVMVFEEQSKRIQDLEVMGFKCQADVGENSWSKVLMQRDAALPVKVYQPPAGYVVRSLSGEGEAEAYVELHRSVFESKNMTVDWRRRAIRHPAYRQDLDLVVEAPDGRLAAFCICWFDKTTSSGQVEPLGCHKDFRKYALGRVALAEGLYRLQRLGAKTVHVETDSYRNTAFRLYESFDFQSVRNVLVYRKLYGI
jgi:ribosomal protein S18 acetylase RimI-like enzyme